MNRQDAIRELQEKFRNAGSTLNEVERRLWAAREAVGLGRGGITLVSESLRMSPNTIKRGIRELESGRSGAGSGQQSRIRRSGGGRKSKTRSSDKSER
jgi:hypothetical protein